MEILHLTEVLPAPIAFKKHENNALLVSVKNHQMLYPDSKHVLVLIIPYISGIGAIFSKRRKQYYQLRKQKEYTVDGIQVQVIALPASGYSWPVLRPVLDVLSWWSQRKRLGTLVKEKSIRLIHAHNVYNSANLARRLSQKHLIPYVVTTRNMMQFFNSRTIRQHLAQSSALISLNHVHKQLAEELAPSIPSFLIPHGIDHSFFHYAGSSIPHKSASAALRLVSICRLIPLKNIDKILYALKQVSFDFVYDIYGDGPESERLKQLCNQLNLQSKVNFWGHIAHAEVPETLSGYDVFIMPSYPETLGIAYLEAMSLGLPVIASRTSGISGYLEHGVSGFLVDQHNIPQLSEILSQLVNNPELRKRIGQKAQEIASAFSWENNLRQLQNIYLGTLKDFERKNTLI